MMICHWLAFWCDSIVTLDLTWGHRNT